MMKRILLASTFLLALTFAQGPALAEDSVGPEVGKPLQAAQALIKSGQFREALAKLHEADNVSGKSAYETSVIEQLRAIAAVNGGEPAVAAKAVEALLASGKTSPADGLKLTQAVAGAYYKAKDYPNAILWVNRTLKEGGTDPQSRILLAQSYYLSEDYTNSAREFAEQVKAGEKTGQTPSESQYQLLANSYVKLGDTAAYTETLEKLLAAYPKESYWAELIQRVGAKKGFADRLEIDLQRLRLATNGFSAASDYVELAQLALQAGLPGEAQSVIAKGYSAGLLGNGAEAERHKRLKDLADKTAADDQKGLAAATTEAAKGKDGAGLVNTGLDYVGYGRAAEGLPLIEQGIAKGGLKHPEDAQLHLGLAALAAGQKDKALTAFKAAQQAPETQDIAKLWAIKAAQKG